MFERHGTRLLLWEVASLIFPRRSAFVLTVACCGAAFESPLFTVAFPAKAMGSEFAEQDGGASEIAKARELYQSGQYDKCLQYVTQAIADEEYGEDWHVLKIRTQCTIGQYQEALKTLEDSLEKYPNGIRARWLGHEAALMSDQVVRANILLDEIRELDAIGGWRYRDSANQLVLGKCYLKRGGDPKAVLDRYFRGVLDRTPNNVDAHLAVGQLGLDKQDFALAAEHFQQAVDLDGKNPDAFFGLGKAFEPSDSKRANDAISTALILNARHLPSLLSVVDNKIDAEQYEEAEAVVGQVLSINPKQPDAWAYRAVIAHLTNRPDEEAQARKQALSTWRANPGIDYLIGKKLSQKYRFAEGAAHQRRSLVYDPTFLPSRIQLAQDLLRLGEELEGWKLADEVYDLDGYNIVAHNLVTLRSNITKFASIEADGFIVRMDRREAAIYGDQVLGLLREAKQKLCSKYAVETSEPIVIEIFPHQQDFAIRTFGLPGGAGFLGVCFGSVITMNSPAAQGASLTNWKSVLWHEFCHVVTLQKTRNKMPRWLSEGISVYEERQANPAWGQSMNHQYREMILSEDLTPVSQLSSAFLNPDSPQHLQFAYYESSLVVEYLIDTYGLEMLNRVLVDLSIGMTANESLGRYTGSVELLDVEFTEHVRAKALAYAKDVDLSKPDLSILEDPAAAAQWVLENPKNFFAQQQYALYLMSQEEWEQAKSQIDKLIELHPDFNGPDSPHRLLAEVHKKLGDLEAERGALEQVVSRDANDLESHLRLTEMAAAEQDWDRTVKFAEQVLAINPLIPAAHRYLSSAAEQTGNSMLAISSLRALAEMNPLDPADLHYRLASLLHEQGKAEQARREILLALEHAPRYIDAHRLLLKIAADDTSNREAETTDNDSAKGRDDDK